MRVNRIGEPGYAGLATFCKLPLVLEPSGLAGVDVAILGAPFDEAVSHRPGARFGPRAVRMAEDSAGHPPSRPHMLLGVDPFEVLTVVDYGDAETGVRQTPSAATGRSSSWWRRCAPPGAVPIVIGGDHSVAHPDMTAVAEHHGPGKVGVIHFDAHADTATDLDGVVRSHGTPMRLVVDEGSIRGDMFIQMGLRGCWPGPEEFSWMRDAGLSLVHDVRAGRARLRDVRGGGDRRRPRLGRACSCRSISTRSTRPTRPAPARRSQAD